MQLFKPHQPALPSAAEPPANQRGLRGNARAAAAPTGSGVPIVRAVDTYLAVHVDGMPQQVRLLDVGLHECTVVHNTPLSAPNPTHVYAAPADRPGLPSAAGPRRSQRSAAAEGPPLCRCWGWGGQRV